MDPATAWTAAQLLIGAMGYLQEQKQDQKLAKINDQLDYIANRLQEISEKIDIVVSNLAEIKVQIDREFTDLAARRVRGHLDALIIHFEEWASDREAHEEIIRNRLYDLQQATSELMLKSYGSYNLVFLSLLTQADLFCLATFKRTTIEKSFNLVEKWLDANASSIERGSVGFTVEHWKNQKLMARDQSNKYSNQTTRENGFARSDGNFTCDYWCISTIRGNVDDGFSLSTEAKVDRCLREHFGGRGIIPTSSDIRTIDELVSLQDPRVAFLGRPAHERCSDSNGRSLLSKANEFRDFYHRCGHNEAVATAAYDTNNRLREEAAKLREWVLSGREDL